MVSRLRRFAALLLAISLGLLLARQEVYGSETPVRSIADLISLPQHAEDALDSPASPPPGTVMIVNVVLSDNGDDDSFADTNETVDMRVTVLNRMGFDLTNLVATLTTNDPHITCVSNAMIQIGNLADRERRTTTEGFTFLVADVDRESENETFAAAFVVELSADQLGPSKRSQSVRLDLDLDVSGGAGPSVFFESFESGFGAFTAMQIDEDLNAPDEDLGNHDAGLANSVGYRCQYNHPDFNDGRETCYPSAGLPDAFFFDVTDDRAYSGGASLYYGAFLDAVLGFTTPTSQLEAVRTTEPINLEWQSVCSTSRSMHCDVDLDCPIGESCARSSPVLSFKHQISLLDHRTWGVDSDGVPGSTDRGVVHAQLADDNAQPVGDWIKLYPTINAYDTVPLIFRICAFDPIDDGNTEGDFYDPPTDRLGPSSTCRPERNFVDQGETGVPFAPDNIGDASDGPGLEGLVGEGTWVHVEFDLYRFRGRRIRLRFLATSLEDPFQLWEDRIFFNPDPRDDGWFIDDVTVTDTLIAPATVSADGSPNLEIKQDLDFDDRGATCDCNSQDETAWDAPGEVNELWLQHAGGTLGSTTLAWSPPVSLGGTTVTYDVIRSIGGPRFVQETSSCIESNDGSDEQATDDVAPESGGVHFFLVRAENSCGGTAGATSAGVARQVLLCPEVPRSPAGHARRTDRSRSLY